MGFLSAYFVALLLSGMLAVIHGEVHHYDFVLKEKNFTRLCNTKSMLVVNDSWPGPVIRVHKGDTVYVNVHNQGDYDLTIHWHGVRQPRNPWSDGPVYITQCPIQPGTNFTYEVIFSEEEGTLWWHAHSNWTRNSVHGAIVIYPAKGTTFPYPQPDGEEIAILGVWYSFDLNLAIEEDLDGGGYTDLQLDALTINGQPGDFSVCSRETTFRWLVDDGKTYLLRVVNTAMDEFFFFAIAGHNLTIVGTDGAYIKPVVTSYIMIGSGQTMDILVTTNQPLGQYYMGAREFYSGNLGFDDYSKLNATAILQYRGNYSSVPPSFPGSLPSYIDYGAGLSFMKLFRSLASQDHPIDVPQNITTRMFMTTSMNENVHNFHTFLTASLNNVTWVDPAISVLEAYYRNISGFYTTDFPDRPPEFFDFLAESMGLNVSQCLRGTKVKMVDYNEDIEIVFQSTNVLNSSQNHPMHLHGHSVYVVGLGEGIFNSDEDPKGYNLVDPPYVNTVTVPKTGWVAIRFRTDNPGVWLLHCHIEHHYSYGMITVIITKNGGTPKTSMRDPPPYMPRCGSSLVPGIQLKSETSHENLGIEF